MLLTTFIVALVEKKRDLGRVEIDLDEEEMGQDREEIVVPDEEEIGVGGEEMGLCVGKTVYLMGWKWVQMGTK